MAIDILKKLGLSDGEIKIYKALLNNGRCPINIIHEHTGIERRNIYDILNKLIERGLVSYVTENKKRYFKIVHPNRLLGYLDEKKDELEKTKEEISKDIPALIEKFNYKKPNLNAEVYRGIEGVKSVWEDMLNYKNVRWIGSGRYVPLKLPHWFANWNRRRIKKKVKFINIMRFEMRDKIEQYQEEELRYLPKEFSANPAVLCVYGNKIVNFLLGEDFFAFVVESKELAENYRAYHKYLWDNVCKK